MDNPLISIIVPIYKVEKYLSKCVESIVHQTYKNLEIILVDDGSPDRCGKMCDEYAAKDNRIKVIHKQNGGLSDARNIAIDIAKGEYITFVDSDDYVARNYIEELISLIEKYRVKISVVRHVLCLENGKLLNKSNAMSSFSTNTINAVNKILYQKEFETSVWGKLYHRSLFESGTRYPKDLLYEDLATTYKIFLLTDRIAFSYQQLYNYLQRQNSLDHTKLPANKIDSSINIIKALEKDLNKDDNFAKSLASRIVSFSFHLLFKMPKGYKNKNLLFNYIKKYRKTVILDSNSRTKVRIVCVVSYLGLNFILNLLSLVYPLHHLYS